MFEASVIKVKIFFIEILEEKFTEFLNDNTTNELKKIKKFTKNQKINYFQWTLILIIQNLNTPFTSSFNFLISSLNMLYYFPAIVTNGENNSNPEQSRVNILNSIIITSIIQSLNSSMNVQVVPASLNIYTKSSENPLINFDVNDQAPPVFSPCSSQLRGEKLN